jgi:hypothetical protein
LSTGANIRTDGDAACNAAQIKYEFIFSLYALRLSAPLCASLRLSASALGEFFDFRF